MKKNLWLGLVIAVLVAGLGVVISGESMRFGEAFGSMKGLNARMMGLIALPFIAALFFAGTYLRKKNVERKWKNAMLKSRARKQNQSKDT